MVRVQVHLTNSQWDELVAISRATGRSRSELIREAIGRYIKQTSARRRRSAIAKAAGMWKDRKDLPDFKAIRAEFDRFL